ncbi:hypothetical protein VNO77_19644 [Canavalia gladiata]|uniref:Uncharacterized protein n=1 Tax=Canavalia gladiata TaxID=3824 RepID=A0AAN9LRX4_CANGL
MLTVERERDERDCDHSKVFASLRNVDTFHTVCLLNRGKYWNRAHEMALTFVFVARACCRLLWIGDNAYVA